ncbi:MAG: YbhB/YbcL family Raf kinase inhibitor-like protein [Alphaproteobacteria bacterium]|nr:YbhB/YbcL family Raf kinase inhibitor-like protein [Alphaproteobacteria bacterium]MBU6471477.1 YbhB/YbcL family Raf kinase inhibitor-like protein [Alphaproteobacteria bacterium]MDE2012139.1 YbhB/YbcL family Raf kinase inhibitor-like protein [Alphaproteobacteria bacterium]MDE2072152.1 YbhB/YbcL family Raf kinase inhibitor-like protein [Alphaproteobacteria bacterium]MDE2353152.1 YbhB/YbcL family Raf kinase inhibitor-like protein [Alphaproteobacteria bacterium]
MTLTSSDIRDGTRVPRQQIYTGCGGSNVSPELSWSGAPAKTKGFALTVFDPDAPHKGGWWHWIALGIPASQNRLARGAGAAGGSGMPKGAVQGTNDFGDTSYDGPCPPKGHKPHRYQFVLWALDTRAVPFAGDVQGPAAVMWLMEHAIAKATMTPVYGR